MREFIVTGKIIEDGRIVALCGEKVTDGGQRMAPGAAPFHRWSIEDPPTGIPRGIWWCIKKGGDRFVVRLPHEIALHPVSPSDGRAPYVSTDPDETKANNLGALPECPT